MESTEIKTVDSDKEYPIIFMKNNFTIELISVQGLMPALYGLLLSHGVTGEISYTEFANNPELINRGLGVAQKLLGKGNGHDKFLESIQVWLIADMPRYFWQEFDTYRVGGSRQSESTMHTLGKRQTSKLDYVLGIDEAIINGFNNLIISGSLPLKPNLPEGFLQKRQLNFNMKSLHTMLMQRRYHKLTEWQTLCDVIEHIYHVVFKLDSDFKLIKGE